MDYRDREAIEERWALFAVEASGIAQRWADNLTEAFAQFAKSVANVKVELPVVVSDRTQPAQEKP